MPLETEKSVAEENMCQMKSAKYHNTCRQTYNVFSHKEKLKDVLNQEFDQCTLYLH